MTSQEGKLVYIPSESLLLEDSPDPAAFVRTVRPGVFLVVSDNEGSYSVLHEGCKYLVKKDQAYTLNKRGGKHDY